MYVYIYIYIHKHTQIYICQGIKVISHDHHHLEHLITEHRHLSPLIRALYQRTPPKPSPSGLQFALWDEHCLCTNLTLSCYTYLPVSPAIISPISTVLREGKERNHHCLINLLFVHLPLCPLVCVLTSVYIYIRIHIHIHTGASQ